MFEAMKSENAHQVLTEMKEEKVVPREWREENFAIMVADNIDRTEM